MKRILVIGCPGSGKSTFARELSRIYGIEVCHLDNLYWNADKTTVEKGVFLERLGKEMEKESLIVDGNFSSTMDMRMSWCDTVFFLDLSADICLESVRGRRGKARTDIPWIETEEDEEFMQFIKSFNDLRRPAILELIEKHKKDTVVFTSRTEVNEYLYRLENKQ